MPAVWIDGITMYGPVTSLAPVALTPAGSNAPHNNLMPYLTFTFCIALQGYSRREGRTAFGDLIDGYFQRCRRGIDAGVGRNGEEFVNARPGYGPWCLSLRELHDMGIRGIMPGRIFSMGVNEQVAVDGDHPPRP